MSIQSLGGLWRESLWEYAVRVYEHKEVKRIVLSLQDEYYANVDIILWCCWLEAEGIHLSKEALDDVLITVDTVNQATLIKIREVRRHLKDAGSFTQVQARVISKQLLNAELMIEKVLVHRLQDLTRRFMEVMTDPEDPLNLTYYLDLMMIPDGPQIAHLIGVGCRSQRSVPV